MTITDEMIESEIKNCYWLSQNRYLGSSIKDICTGYCLPCKRVIEIGQCDTLMELFAKAKKGE